tara:strand:- start:805 stop:981 length:177 start_codon:yes stop_codon:yes gene_type:complete
MNAQDTRLLIDLLNEHSTIVFDEYIELKAQGATERELQQHRREIAHMAQLKQTLKEKQ